MMNKTYTSGDWYMTISNEKPMTDDGKTYCKFDLIKYKDSFWGCPVNQFGSIEGIVDVLKSWKEIDNRPEYENIYKLNEPTRKMEDDFINTLQEMLK